MREPDCLVPEQFFAHYGRRKLQAEKLLLLALLNDAIHCFYTYRLAHNSRERQLFLEAEEWIDYQNPRWIFSFDNVCEMLGIDPNNLRSALKRWKERRLP